MRGFSAVGRRAKIERLISQVSEQQKDLKERLEQLNKGLKQEKTKEVNKESKQERGEWKLNKDSSAVGVEVKKLYRGVTLESRRVVKGSLFRDQITGTYRIATKRASYIVLQNEIDESLGLYDRYNGLAFENDIIEFKDAKETEDARGHSCSKAYQNRAVLGLKNGKPYIKDILDRESESLCYIQVGFSSVANLLSVSKIVGNTHKDKFR